MSRSIWAAPIALKPFPPHLRGLDPGTGRHPVRLPLWLEELMKFTLLTRDRADYPVDRFSERKERAEALTRRVNLSAST